MDREHRDKWIAALRSGDYVQCRCALRNGDRYCALGVLADVTGCTWDEHSPGRFSILGGHTAHLPKDLLRSVDLGAGRATQVSRRNDKGHTFHELAEWIEENL